MKFGGWLLLCVGVCERERERGNILTAREPRRGSSEEVLYELNLEQRVRFARSRRQGKGILGTGPSISQA